MTLLDQRGENVRRNEQQALAVTQVIVGLRNGHVPNKEIAQLSDLLDVNLHADDEIGSAKRKRTSLLTANLEAAYGLDVITLVREYRAAADIRTQNARR